MKAKEQIEGKPCGEMRLDLLKINADEAKILWKSADDWILTLREEFTKTPDWKSIFKECLGLNPIYIDIDSELPQEIKFEVIKWVKSAKLDLILSYHDFDKTPNFETLNTKISELFIEGADVVKVACMALKEDDNLTMMDLYKEHKRVIAFCMGELGKESRVTSLFFGEKLSYVAPSNNDAVAPGQFTYNELYELINFGFDE